MVSWRSWLAVVFVALAVAAACSGKTDSPPPKGTGGSAGKSSAGSGGRAGAAGSGAGGSAGTLGEAGEGGAPPTPTGGTAGGFQSGGAGFGGTAGTFGLGGTGVAGGGTAGVNAAGTTGTLPPFGWNCEVSAYGTGECDCGCGEPDPDCKNDKLGTCKVCDGIGSCNGAKCPGRIDEDDPTRCEPVPTGWTCMPRAYEDGSSCDCGCGIPDPDCEGEGRDACDTCGIIGSCSLRECPGSIDDADNSKCWFPPGWSCNSFDYGDGICDCGCAAQDVDCPSTSVEDCEYCSHGCSFSSCPGTIDPNDSSFCTTPPFDWNCADRFYNDGSLCHCGCGAIDPDCDPAEAASCDGCNAEGSCSASACPGTINPDDIRYCIQPDPPPEWTCEGFYYADGGSCDCGCGVVDLDCRGATAAFCEGCWACGDCARVDPADISSCLPPPDGWTCADDRYGDQLFCDCGCGVSDPDCGGLELYWCSECPVGSCSRSDCRDLAPEDNTVCEGGPPQGWSCPADYYGDTACDCGCGGQDEDCASLSRTECDFCDSPGSCSAETEGCPGIVNADDNRICDSG